MQGYAEPYMKPLADAFARCVDAAEGGCALSVYHQGRPVVDLWGGRRLPDGTPWEQETPCISFSTTKGIASTAAHICADRGLLDYDEPVARYWPEFAQKGKGAITVRQIMCHEAGLYDVRSMLDRASELLDWNKVIRSLECATPAHRPGRFNSYHGLTYGYLVGELVGRVSGRHLREFVRDEIAEPLGLDHMHIGAPPEAIAVAARLFPLKQNARQGAHRPPRRVHVERNPGARAGRGRRSFSLRRTALRGVFGSLRLIGLPTDPARSIRALAPRRIVDFDFSSDEAMAACNPSAGGLFTARALAHMYALLAGGGELDGVRLLSERTVREASRVQNRRPDGVLWLPVHWRLGYHSVLSSRGLHRGAFGHYGYRGSGAFADPKRAMAFAFVTNCGSGSPIGDKRIFQLGGLAARCADGRP